MAYDQYSNYPQQQRPYYNQAPPPRGQPRGAPPPSRGPDPYANAYPQAGYGQDSRYQQQQSNARVDNYAGYDGEDILDQYGEDEQNQQAYNQQYQQGGYGYGGPNGLRGQTQRPGPQQYREPPQQRDNYGEPPPQQGYGNGMNGQMGGPGGRGRAQPPQGYPPQQRGYPPQQGFGAPRAPPSAPQGYDDRRQYPPYDDQAPYQSQENNPLPQQKPRERLLQPLNSPKTIPFDNPFPIFSAQSAPVSDTDIAERAMAGVDLNGRSSQESKRPLTSGSQQSQTSGRSNSNRPLPNQGYGAAPRRSEDGYGPQPSFASPQRAMTMPQNLDEPGNNRRFNQDPGPYPQPQRGYDAGGYPRGPQDPIPQRSFTSVGDMRGPQQPVRPSTATGMRAPPNMGPRNAYPNDGFGRPPPPQGFMPPRPGTSQGYREGPGPTQQRPPITKEAQLETYMPDFDSQPPANQPLKDAIGLPLDAAPEASKTPLNAQPAQNTPYDLRSARSQPNLRAQANGYNQNGYPTEPVPKMPPLNAGSFSGQQRIPPGPLVTDPSQMVGPQYSQMSSPTSPRQFHRPGAPPIMRQEIAQSGYSDPGPAARQGTPMGRPGAGQSGRAANPDALPAHPTPVRPGLSNAGRPGAADIRQQQASRMSGETGRPVSGPITIQELLRLREACKAQPQNQAQQLRLAKKLVEAAVLLSDENGGADARTTQRNRENYVNEAYKTVKKLVAANYGEAMFYLADCYGTGDLGLAVDPKEAFVLYQSAAKLGHGPSAYRTAVCCEMGQENGGGTRKDPLKAVQWYRRAAALGDVPAMYKLGMILLKGHLGQPVNMTECVIWLDRAAKLADVDNPHALHELAGLHENAPPGGNGKIIRDEKYALELYTRAAKFGYRNSQARLGQVFEYGQLGVAIDNRSSIHWYSKAAAQEDHDAELAISGWYLTGSAGILEQNDQEAYLWARKAALAENSKAEFAMGYFSETGIGCPKSFDDAKRWYGRAAGHRYPKARERLDELTRSGTMGMRSKERISRSDTKKHEECIVM